MKMLNKQPFRKSRTKYVEEVRDNIQKAEQKEWTKTKRHTERRVRQNGELVSGGGSDSWQLVTANINLSNKYH